MEKLSSLDYRTRYQQFLMADERSIYTVKNYLGDLDAFLRWFESKGAQEFSPNLMTNAVVTWNTLYMEAALEQLKSEGHQIIDEDIQRLSPTRYEHINPYGTYQFDIEGESKRAKLRPLRHAQLNL